MPNVFSAQAPWISICNMAKDLARPPIPEWAKGDPEDCRQDLCYVVRPSNDVHDECIIGEVEHEIEESHFVWRGFSRGVDGVSWMCDFGALMDLCLQRNDDYRIRFIGTNRHDTESFDLFRFLRTVDLGTIKVEQVDWDKLIKLVRNSTVTETEVLLMKHFGKIIAATLLDPARKDAKEIVKARD